MRKLSKWLKFIGLSVLSVVLVFALLVAWAVTSRDRARTNWKTSALRELREMSLSNEVILAEVARARESGMSGGTHGPVSAQDWSQDHVVLMTNGQYLVYAWRHGVGDMHLFLAHGTDNKWYYSTYHFCSGLSSLSWEEPAGSIGEFAERFHLREFDGISDECLQRTWQPPPLEEVEALPAAPAGEPAPPEP